jgi:DNA-directed RNA polymerase specialized sigma24 family protein
VTWRLSTAWSSRYQDSLFRWVYHHRRYSLADDITQTVFVTAFKKSTPSASVLFAAGCFASPEPGLRRAPPPEAPPSHRPGCDPREDQDKELLESLPMINPSRRSGRKTEQEKLVRDGLERLPKPFASAHLVDMEGLDYQEVAKVINVPLGTVRPFGGADPVPQGAGGG